jgi:hypothetical protein
MFKSLTRFTLAGFIAISAFAQAVGAADSLKTFLETPLAHPQRGDVTVMKLIVSW